MQEQTMPTKLYVGNLPYETTETDLHTLVSASGGVASVNLMRDRATGQARGFAFVEMNSMVDAQTAIRELDQRTFASSTNTRNGSEACSSRLLRVGMRAECRQHVVRRRHLPQQHRA
jgi:RNA recognition motif-containing protein